MTGLTHAEPAGRAAGPAAGPALRSALRRIERLKLLRDLALVAPLFVFLLVILLVPILLFMFRAIDNRMVPEMLPMTVAALAGWDGNGLPGEPAYAALAADLAAVGNAGDVAVLGRRLNEDTWSVQIMDSRERLVSLWKPDLKEYAVVRSTMPSFKDTLSAADRADVVAYLLSLKPAPPPPGAGGRGGGAPTGAGAGRGRGAGQ